MTLFLRCFAIGYLGLLLAVVGLTWLIDPYDYWGSPVIDGLNRYKPAAARHLASVKLRQYARVRAPMIVAGNSRVDVGFDPQSPAWPASARPVYNMGLPGVSTRGVAESLVRAMNIHRPRTIYLGVDFLDFRISRRDWRAYAHLTLGTGTRRFADEARERIEVLLSLAALTDSIATITEQRARYPAHVTSLGYNGLGEYHDLVATEGHAALFEQRNRENLKAWLSGPKAVRWPEPGGSDAWAALEQLAAECRKRGIRLVLFTYPYHADILLGVQRAGLWSAFKDWTRTLARVGVRERVPVWFFTRIDAVATEAVPAEGDTTTRLHWYWEAGHFKAALGDRMIAAMTDDAPFGFDMRLTPETADAKLGALQQGLASYQARRASDAARLDATFRTVAARLLSAAP